MQEEPSKGKRWIGKNVKFERIRRILPQATWSARWTGSMTPNERRKPNASSTGSNPL